MKRLLFFVTGFFLVGGMFFPFVEVFATVGASCTAGSVGTCVANESSCTGISLGRGDCSGSEEVCCSNGSGTEDRCAGSSAAGTCETAVSGSCPGNRTFLGSSATCSASGKICCQKASSSNNICTSNCGAGGTCLCESMSSCVSPKTTVSTDNGYCRGIDSKAVCCKTPSSSSCTGGQCGSVGACPSGSTHKSECDGSAGNCGIGVWYCTSGGGGSGTTAVKCDPAKFKEYAGVCFPLNTGLSEMSVAKIVMNLMKWMLYLFGFLAIIAFVISGIQYLSAAGNMNMIETAKRNMTWSIVGVIVALAGLVIIIAIDALLRGTAWGG